MKKTLYLRIGLIATIIGLVLITFGKDAFQMLMGSRGVVEDSIPVLVAERYIPPFQILRPSFVKVRRFPREYVPVGALQSLNDLQRDNGQFLFVTVVGIPGNQPLTRMALNEAGRTQGMSSLLNPGKVAVSFQVERSRAAGGWIKPGDTIAIFRSLSPQIPGGPVNPEAPLLLESIQVLAVDHNHVGEKPNDKEQGEVTQAVADLTQQEADHQILTVLANTREASAIVEARERGPLSVVLRSMGDDMPWFGRSATSR